MSRQTLQPPLMILLPPLACQKPLRRATAGGLTEHEVKLLLDYVEANCTLTTGRGLNLKKSEFSKARATIKSKDVNQCHYKWGHVCIFFIDKGFHYLSTTYHSL